MIADDALSLFFIFVACIWVVATIAVALSIVYEVGEWLVRRFRW